MRMKIINKKIAEVCKQVLQVGVGKNYLYTPLPHP